MWEEKLYLMTVYLCTSYSCEISVEWNRSCLSLSSMWSMWFWLLILRLICFFLLFFLFLLTRPQSLPPSLPPSSSLLSEGIEIIKCLRCLVSCHVCEQTTSHCNHLMISWPLTHHVTFDLRRTMWDAFWVKVMKTNLTNVLCWNHRLYLSPTSWRLSWCFSSVMKVSGTFW